MNLISNKVLDEINKIVDILWLCLIFFITCIPIITIGAATTSLYYVMLKVIKNDRGYVTSQYFSCFKKNFKQSTIIWLLLLAIYAFLGFDFIIMKSALSMGDVKGYVYYFFLFLMAIITVWSLYFFPYVARFQNTTKNLLRNTLIISILNIQWTLLLAGLFAFAWALIYMYAPVGLIMPAMYHLFKIKIIERVFEKYMTPEDLEAEAERNRIYH